MSIGVDVKNVSGSFPSYLRDDGGSQPDATQSDSHDSGTTKSVSWFLWGVALFGVSYGGTKLTL